MHGAGSVNVTDTAFKLKSKYYGKCLATFFKHFPACHKFLDNSIEIGKKNEKASMVISHYVKCCLRSNQLFISILSTSTFSIDCIY